MHCATCLYVHGKALFQNKARIPIREFKRAATFLFKFSLNFWFAINLVHKTEYKKSKGRSAFHGFFILALMFLAITVDLVLKAKSRK